MHISVSPILIYRGYISFGKEIIEIIYIKKSLKLYTSRNKDILLIFLINAGLIALVGGLIGVFLGILLSGALPAMMGQTMMARGGTIVSLNSVVMALSVSVFVGILAGIVPAYQGSRLKPVDALRYE